MGDLVLSLIENLTSMVAENVLEEVSLLATFGDDFDILCLELKAIESLLKDAEDKRNSRSMCSWLEKFEDFLQDAADIVEDCAAGRKINNPIFRHRMSQKIKKLKERLIKIHESAKYIKYLTSVLDVNARVRYNSEGKREIYRGSDSQREIQPVDMAENIQHIRELILKKESGHQVISVFGMGGTGKTLLVRQVFDTVIKEYFDYKIWIEVSKEMDVTQVLKQMRDQILDTEDITELPGDSIKDDQRHNKKLDTSDKEKYETIREDIKKNLRGKLSLFVLDDVWTRDVLDQFKFLSESNSKLLITTRHTEVAESLSQTDTNRLKMKPLSEESSWKLFCLHAFPDLPDDKDAEGLTKFMHPEWLNKFKHSILEKCCGLPLALKTIGSSMAKVKMLPNDWEWNLNRLSATYAKSDPVMASLRLSYEDLPDYLKHCFLYCSVFPKKMEIHCEYLVYAWVALQFISPQVAAPEDAYEVGRSYLDDLINRSLIEVSQVGGDGRVERCKMYDLLHDLAVSESAQQTKCFLKPGENLESLPVDECSGSRRISLIKNKISGINEAIKCPRLRILLLSGNGVLASISASVFNNLTYLTVLDLSRTAIKSLPKSIGNLRHLKFLNLSRTNISMLPEDCNGLSHLQFLDVSYCSYLSKLHSGIRKHKFLLHLNLESCGILKSLPKGISKLIHLQTFKCTLSDANANSLQLQLSKLKGLTRLQHLALEIDVPSEGEHIQLNQGTFGDMKKMRILSVKSSSLLNLPPNMEVMERLEIVHLSKCLVPEWISQLHNLMELVLDQVGNDYRYNGLESLLNLKKLHLSRNLNCRQLPNEFGENMAFRKLEELIIENFHALEKFQVLGDKPMPMLRYLRFRWCEKLKNIGEGLYKLQSLQEVEIRRLEVSLDLWNREGKRILQDRKIKIKDSVRLQVPVVEV